MGYVLTLIYTALVFLSVADIAPGLAPYRPSLALAVLATVGSLPVLLTRQHFLRMPEFLLMWGFIGSILFSLLMVGWLGGMLSAMIKFLPSAVLFFLFLATCTTVRRVRIALWVWVGLAVYIVFRGSVAYRAGVMPSPWLFEQRFYEFGGMEGDIITLIRMKAQGILNDPNDTAQFLVIAIPILWLAWRKRSPFRNLFLVIVPACWLFYGLFLTRSRGSLVGLVVVLMVASYKKLGKFASVIVPGAVVAGLLAVGFSGGRAISIAGGVDRINLWSEGLGMFKRSPLWGVCFGGFMEYSSHTAHNSFVVCFAELGLIGYFFFIGLIVVSMMRLHRLSDDPTMSEEMRQTATILKYVMYAFISTSWFLTRTYDPILYMLVGMTGALGLIKVEQTQTASVYDYPIVSPPKWMKWTFSSMFASIAMVYIMVRSRGL